MKVWLLQLVVLAGVAFYSAPAKAECDDYCSMYSTGGYDMYTLGADMYQLQDYTYGSCGYDACGGCGSSCGSDIIVQTDYYYLLGLTGPGNCYTGFCDPTVVNDPFSDIRDINGIPRDPYNPFEPIPSTINYLADPRGNGGIPRLPPTLPPVFPPIEPPWFPPTVNPPVVPPVVPPPVIPPPPIQPPPWGGCDNITVMCPSGPQTRIDPIPDPRNNGGIGRNPLTPTTPVYPPTTPPTTPGGPTHTNGPTRDPISDPGGINRIPRG